MNKTTATRPAPWSADEDRAVVRDYLAMMGAHRRAEKVNKTATRRALLPLLNGRSESSVEFKRCNVSAVLAELGYAWLPGYRPASNYQRSLVDVVRVEILRLSTAGETPERAPATAAAAK